MLCCVCMLLCAALCDAVPYRLRDVELVLARAERGEEEPSLLPAALVIPEVAEVEEKVSGADLHRTRGSLRL